MSGAPSCNAREVRATARAPVASIFLAMSDTSPPPDDPVAPGTASFTPEEQRALRTVVAAGEAPGCPREGTAMRRRPSGGGSLGRG